MSKDALAHRIENLEARLAAAIEGNAPNAMEDPQQTSGVSENTSLRPPGTKKRHLGDGVRFLTLCHEDNGEPSYLEPSSGLSMAENISRLVHDGIGMKLLPLNGSNQEPEAILPNITETKVGPPDDAVGSQILDAYFKNMHVRFPFLDGTEIFQLHAKRHQLPEATPEAQFAHFKLFMVYAIGAAICQMTETYDSTTPNAFLIAALQFEPTLRESYLRWQHRGNATACSIQPSIEFKLECLVHDWIGNENLRGLWIPQRSLLWKNRPS